jgi:hypothetical protein
MLLYFRGFSPDSFSFLHWLILRPLRWRRNVPSKRPWTSADYLALHPRRWYSSNERVTWFHVCPHIINVNSVLLLLNHVDVGDIDVSEIHAASVYKVERCKVLLLAQTRHKSSSPCPPLSFFETWYYISTETHQPYTLRPWRWKQHLAPKRWQHHHRLRLTTQERRLNHRKSLKSVMIKFDEITNVGLKVMPS